LKEPRFCESGKPFLSVVTDFGRIVRSRREQERAVLRRTTIVTPQNHAPAISERKYFSDQSFKIPHKEESILIVRRLVSLLAAMGSAATYLAYLDPLAHRFKPKLFPSDYCSTTNPCQ
ncbi:hypothetical protein ALC62_14508, partial [Cyphomyrmex costatus]